MKLSTMLVLWRATNKKTQRESAEEIGIPAKAYGRLERGKGVDAENFMKAMNWLMVP